MTGFVTMLVSAIRLSSTFLFGSTGEIVTEKSGHLNLGIPGIMSVGALCGVAGEYFYMNYVGFDNMNGFLAVLIPILSTLLGGGLMGLLYSFLTVTLRSNQNITGLAMTTFGVGVTKFFIEKIRVNKNFVPIPYSKASVFFIKSLPFADNLGVVGQILFSYGVMVYLAIIIAVLASVFLGKTKAGLNLRAVGENPATADAAGINVTKYRYISTIVGSAIAGLGGLSFVMDYLGGNWEYQIEAMGWLAIALVIFAMWKPWLSIFGSIIFAAAFIASNYIVGISFAQKELVKMLPYVVTIIVLVVTSILDLKSGQAPAGLGLNYFREDR